MAREIIAADCETDPFKHGRIPAPFIWGWYDGKEYNWCTDTKEFIDYVRLRNCIVYAHNGGKFDWHFLLPFIPDFEPLMIINGRLSSFKIGTAEFRDSYNILPMAQAKWAEKTDIEDWSIFEETERDKPENWGKIQERLETDVRGLYETVQAFIGEFGRNLTLAGSAMNYWKKHFMIGVPPKTGKEFHEQFRPFYFGGRVECFQKGIIDKPFTMIDIKSAYPYAMKFWHPWGETYEITDSIDGLSTEDVTKSFIKLRCRSQGAFPYRDKTGLNFPADNETREFHVTGWEFMAANETGHLCDYEILQVVSLSSEITFALYVDHFFERKQEAEKIGDKNGRMFAKLFLNSLYGKFAANPANYQEYVILPLELGDELSGDEWSLCHVINESNGVFNRPLSEDKHRYYNVATAASITGFVRAHLWTALQQVSGRLYCDTDCIVAHDVSGLELGQELGQWGIEGKFSRGGIAGKKLYAFTGGEKWKTASKGVRLTATEIMRVAKGETVIYSPDAPTFSVNKQPWFIDRAIKMT